MEKINKLKNILNIFQKKQFIFLFCFMLLAVLLEILVLKFLLIILNFFSNPGNDINSSTVIFLQNLKGDLSFPFLIICIFVIIFLLKTLINIFLNFQKGKFLFNTKADVSLRLMRGYLYMPRIFHMRTNTSELVRNITVEVDNLMTSLLNILTIILDASVLIGLVIFLCFVNFKITIISFFALVFFSFLVSGVNRKKTIQLGKKRVKIIQLRLKNIIEALSGSKTFTITGSRDKAISDFSVNNSQLAKLSYKNFFRNGLPKPLFELFTVLIIGSFFIFVQQKNLEISSIIPTLGVFLAAVYRLIPSFANIMSNIQSYQFNIQCVTNLSNDLEKFKNIKNINQEKINFIKSLDFNEVTFSYGSNERSTVFKNINISIKKGSKIGIVGPSGSGKSTFLDIFMGLLPVQSGQVLIDGKNIKNQESGWQKNIGCVPQEVFISDDTLKKNVAFGESDEKIDNTKLLRAIELAGLKNFVENLDLKENTIIGERGSRVSGGQRQRIGIARAFYNNPDLLILDEATNALDEQIEKKIIDEIFSTGINRTIIFVSHNYQNLRHCDSIYKIENQRLSLIE